MHQFNLAPNNIFGVILWGNNCQYVSQLQKNQLELLLMSN